MIQNYWNKKCITEGIECTFPLLLPYPNSNEIVIYTIPSNNKFNAWNNNYSVQLPISHSGGLIFVNVLLDSTSKIKKQSFAFKTNLPSQFFILYSFRGILSKLFADPSVTRLGFYT